MRIYKEVTDPAVLKKRSSIKGKTVREAQKTFRITDVNEFVEAGIYLRIHVHPKRFPRYGVVSTQHPAWIFHSNIAYLSSSWRLNPGWRVIIPQTAS